MARALSVDLRRRVVGAIEEGASCRQAAVRFGVSASSAIRWAALARRAGDPAPRRQGGDRRSARIEAHAPVILGAIERRADMTLADLRSELAGRGIAVSVAGLWRFFARRKITVKKSPGMPRSRTVPTS
jgi:transposase